MIEALKGWILTICSGLFFTIVVEMILPNTTMKKYAKFVLGLILMMIIMNPFIKFFDKNFDANLYVRKADQYLNQSNFQNDFVEYKEKSIKDTENVFKLNLEQACEKLLMEKYPKGNYKVKVGVKYNKEIENYVIETVDIGGKETTIEKVNKIDINASSNCVNTKKIESEEEKKVREYISEKLKISKESIRITKL